MSWADKWYKVQWNQQEKVKIQDSFKDLVWLNGEGSCRNRDLESHINWSRPKIERVVATVLVLDSVPLSKLQKGIVPWG